MVAPSAGSVVLIPFSFSDLSRSKLRPAVVLAHAERGDWILCRVTDNPYADPHSVTFSDGDFRAGSLRITSYARPGKLFTANQDLFVSEAGSLKSEPFERIVGVVIDILRGGTAAQSADPSRSG